MWIIAFSGIFVRFFEFSPPYLKAEQLAIIMAVRKSRKSLFLLLIFSYIRTFVLSFSYPLVHWPQGLEFWQPLYKSNKEATTTYYNKRVNNRSRGILTLHMLWQKSHLPWRSFYLRRGITLRRRSGQQITAVCVQKLHIFHVYVSLSGDTMSYGDKKLAASTVATEKALSRYR